MVHRTLYDSDMNHMMKHSILRWAIDVILVFSVTLIGLVRWNKLEN